MSETNPKLKIALNEVGFDDEQISLFLKTYNETISSNDNTSEHIEAINPISENTVMSVINTIDGLAREFIRVKFSHDKTGLWVYLILAVIILVIITILGMSGNIDSGTTSALLGSFIGYTLGRFSNPNFSKKQNE